MVKEVDHGFQPKDPNSQDEPTKLFSEHETDKVGPDDLSKIRETESLDTEAVPGEFHGGKSAGGSPVLRDGDDASSSPGAGSFGPPHMTSERVSTEEMPMSLGDPSPGRPGASSDPGAFSGEIGDTDGLTEAVGGGGFTGEIEEAGGLTEPMGPVRGLTEELKTGGGPTEQMSVAQSPGRGQGLRAHAHADDSFDENDEVLVLLPDDQQGTEGIPLVETETIADETWNDGADGDQDTESIVNAGLKTANPRNPEAEFLDDFDESAGEPVGVIDEIAALATSLDQDILGADDDEVSGAVGSAGDDGGDFEPEYSSDEFETAPRRGGRLRVLMVAASMAAAIALGVYFYPSILEQFNLGTGSDGSGAVASAGGVPGQPDGAGVEPQGRGDPGSPDATGRQPDPVAKGPGISATPTGSETRTVLREKVLLALDLGIQWDSEEE